MYLNGENEMK